MMGLMIILNKTPRMTVKLSIGIVGLVLVLMLVVGLCLFAVVPRSGSPIRVSHGDLANLSLNHLPELEDAFHAGESIVFPIALFNGGLPLLSLHIGESGSKAAVILDTASEHLLVGDTERCKTCSNDMFGGARGSDSSDDKLSNKTNVVEFGSQKDHVEYRTEDVYMDGYIVPNIKFGLVVHRESLTNKTNTTYNIMGLGGAQTIPGSFINELHARLRKPARLVFGFSLGDTGDDYVDETGVFVMGRIPRDLRARWASNPDHPSFVVPLHRTPINPYCYMSHTIRIFGRPNRPNRSNHTPIPFPTNNIPIIFDTGSNFSDFPKSMEPFFQQIESLSLVFSNNEVMHIPESGLRWHHRHRSALIHFTNQQYITIGTVILSKFACFEFDFSNPSTPNLNFYERG